MVIRTAAGDGLLSFLLCMLLPVNVAAETALVAVAANFSEALAQLEADFEAQTDHSLTVTMGSTGKLYAQILHGAPFDVLLAADQERPAKLVASGLAKADTRFTYALGRLSLWSADRRRLTSDGADVLRAGSFRRLAIANPDLAPYCAAARETLIALGLLDRLRGRIVMGENIGQTHALVATGNAELGFVALSSVLSARNQLIGSRWDVPQDLHKRIRQDAVLLQRAFSNAAARAFLDYLSSAEARAVIQGFGYGLE